MRLQGVNPSYALRPAGIMPEWNGNKGTCATRPGQSYGIRNVEPLIGGVLCAVEILWPLFSPVSRHFSGHAGPDFYWVHSTFVTRHLVGSGPRRPGR